MQLDTLLRRLTSSTGQEQDQVLNHVCQLVFSHAFAEEAVLWPAIRALLPDGDELIRRMEP